MPSVLHGEGAELHRSGEGLPIYWTKRLPRVGMMSSAAVFSGKEIENCRYFSGTVDAGGAGTCTKTCPRWV